MEPGVYPDVSNAEYHGSPGLSKSGLDLIARSPRHYWARYMDPLREREEPSRAMILGSAFHTLVLEPHLFSGDYFTLPDLPRNTKAGKEAHAEAEAEAHASNPLAVGLTVAEMTSLSSMREGLLAHPSARAILERGGRVEHSIVWQDKRTGVICKCRPDLWPENMVVDVKTTRDASPDAFARSAVSFRYHVQDAWYTHGIEAATGEQPMAFVFLCVESAPPYCGAVYVLEQDAREKGRLLAERDLNEYHLCQRDNTWPSYSNDVEELLLPPWAYAED